MGPIGWAVILAAIVGAPRVVTPGASFQFMLIEQVIGGVSGDVTAQAIQLRMRSGSQNQVFGKRLRAWDAAGSNPVVLVILPSDVDNATVGDRILIATP